MQITRLALSMLCLGMLIVPLSSQADEQAVLRNLMDAMQKAQGGGGAERQQRHNAYDDEERGGGRYSGQYDSRGRRGLPTYPVDGGEQYWRRGDRQGSRPGAERPQRPGGQQGAQGSRYGAER